ncbi:MAG: hypothetical protein OEZ48_06720 [Candidatus Bathyarchaeota archaeon]|nr:hypothetical protein [Candidatus Bathyarchaeota archaeon]
MKSEVDEEYGYIGEKRATLELRALWPAPRDGLGWTARRGHGSTDKERGLEHLSRVP